MWLRTEYFGRLGLTIDADAMSAIDRAEAFFSDLGCTSFEDVFIGTRMDEDRVQKYGTLWYFCSNLVYCAHTFTEKVDYSVSVLHRLVHCRMEMEACDFDDVGARARMKVSFVNGSGGTSSMNAAGENVLQLRDVVRRHLLPELRVDSTS